MMGLGNGAAFMYVGSYCRRSQIVWPADQKKKKHTQIFDIMVTKRKRNLRRRNTKNSKDGRFVVTQSRAVVLSNSVHR